MTPCNCLHSPHLLAQLYAGTLKLRDARRLLHHVRRCAECAEVGASLLEQIDERRSRTLSPLAFDDCV